MDTNSLDRWCQKKWKNKNKLNLTFCFENKCSIDCLNWILFLLMISKYKLHWKGNDKVDDDKDDYDYEGFCIHMIDILL